MPLRRNVLIFHSGALGDFVVSWPLALALGRLHPQSRIIYVTQSQKGKLAERVIRVESVDVESGWHKLFSENATLDEVPTRILGSAHSIFSFVSDGGDAWSQNVARISGNASIVNITPRPTRDTLEHISRWHVAQLGSAPAVAVAVGQMLLSISSRGTNGSAPGGGAVLIHPGGGAEKKCWPTERFARLADMVRRSGREVRFILGEVELEKWSPERIQILENSADILRPKTYLDLHAELAKASAFVGNDSGPAHLAGIIGIPTVALFGSEGNPLIWRPLGPRVQVIKCDPLDSLEESHVFDAVVGKKIASPGVA